MDAIRAIIKGGRLELQVPPDWPDGTEVLIEPSQTSAERIGIDDSEWRDDPASLADWETWIKTFEPLKFTPEEAVRIAEFDEKTRRFNMEAVTRQMQEGAGE